VVEVKRSGVDGIAYREAVPAQPSELVPALCLHGFPETSYMWRYVIAALADSGRRAIAPDLPGFGDSPPDPPGTWGAGRGGRRLRVALGLERVALVVHDWGGLIGLRWAWSIRRRRRARRIQHGFFPNGKWHGMARVMRTPARAGVVRALTRGLCTCSAPSPGSTRRSPTSTGRLETRTATGHPGPVSLGDFEKLEAYEGQLAAGRADADPLGRERPVRAGRRRRRFQREIPDAKLVVLEGGHFVYADEPSRCAREVAGFLAAKGSDAALAPAVLERLCV
jgi:haloalkane dehalogenase